MICPCVRANTDERSCHSTFAAEADDCRRSVGQDTLVLSESIPQDSGTLSFRASARFVVFLRRADWPLKYVKDQVFCHVALGTHLLSLSSVSEIVNPGHVGSSLYVREVYNSTTSSGMSSLGWTFTHACSGSERVQSISVAGFATRDDGTPENLQLKRTTPNSAKTRYFDLERVRSRSEAARSASRPRDCNAASCHPHALLRRQWSICSFVERMSYPAYTDLAQ